MAIFAYKNAVTNSVDFLNEVNKKEYINGFILHVTMTKDNKIIGYIPTTAHLSTEVLQNSLLKDLESNSIIELKDILHKLKDFKKKIIIDVIPLFSPQLSSETVDEINKRNWFYIESIKDILFSFQNQLLFLTSSNRNLVTYMQQQINFIKIGRSITPLDLNYQEADFFIIPATMLDATIFEQEIKKNRKIIVEMITIEDMVLVHRFFGSDTERSNEALFHKIEFICSCPILFHSVFKEKGFFT